MKNTTWYITGASKGLGLALIKKLLAKGHNVAATSRHAAALQAAVGSGHDRQFLPLAVDLTNAQAIEESLKQAHERFGALDVVVNNAGYALGGSAEELSLDEMRQSLEINLLATIAVTHSALPYLRAQRAGHFINISSIAGFLTRPGFSLYHTAKFAVVGFTEALAQDVPELGIKATVVLPSGLRTKFLSAESLTIAPRRIEAYGAVHAARDSFNGASGRQAGDPDKVADALLALAENPEPPVRVFLGAVAWQAATERLAQLQQDLAQNKPLAFSIDFNS